jgi:hypothetical protein
MRDACEDMYKDNTMTSEKSKKMHMMKNSDYYRCPLIGPEDGYDN